MRVSRRLYLDPAGSGAEDAGLAGRVVRVAREHGVEVAQAHVMGERVAEQATEVVGNGDAAPFEQDIFLQARPGARDATAVHVAPKTNIVAP